MIKKFPPINPSFPHFMHGGDYNPDQWLESPEIIDEDIRMMKLAGCNTMSLGIFSWSMLEPEEGTYNFEWLDTIMNKLAANGISVILATPSGARPAWLSQKYPEVLRVESDRMRNLHGLRHNHCFTSPVYRQKTANINRLLAERYKGHPALLAWHISNEYGGECHCPLCQEAFRKFLKQKYSDLSKLNHEWWTGFWSHRFTDWSQIESPSPRGENALHGLNLDWKRFVTHQTIDFFKNEIVPIREITPEKPITTNFMGLYKGLDYWEFAKELDVVSWDNYPAWHNDAEPNYWTACETSFKHDVNRSLKGKPFMLMESAPSLVNWMPVNKLKRPEMHMLSSMQAVAHGSDTAQYFQWRKSRGGCEKFHGAVIDHCGHEHTRVFSDVAQVGKTLKKLDAIIGTSVNPEVAIIYDWQNCWAIEDAQAVSRSKTNYERTCMNHYYSFWKRGIPIDIINEEHDFSSYRVLVAPMLYMVRPGVAQRIEKFVSDGGTFVLTYWSGITNENDLCFLGGFPGPLRKVTGIFSEEIDSLYDSDENSIVMSDKNELGINGSFKITDFCDLIHAETADVIGTYGADFYKGRPALTVNRFGKGKAYYMAARGNNDFLNEFYGSIADSLELRRALDTELPLGVTAQVRTDGETEFVFLMNFSDTERTVNIVENYRDMLNDKPLTGNIVLPGYGLKIMRINRNR